MASPSMRSTSALIAAFWPEVRICLSVSMAVLSVSTRPFGIAGMVAGPLALFASSESLVSPSSVSKGVIARFGLHTGTPVPSGSVFCWGGVRGVSLLRVKWHASSPLFSALGGSSVTVIVFSVAFAPVRGGLASVGLAVVAFVGFWLFLVADIICNHPQHVAIA